MPTRKPRVTYATQNKIKLEEFAKTLNMSMGDAIDYLIENRQKTIDADNIATPELEQYSVVEQQEIDKAIANSGLTIEAIVKEGTLQRARYLNSVAVNQAQMDSMSTDELKEATFKGVSRHRISEAVEKIKGHNDLQTEKKNKVCITRGIVFKITGSNRSNINKFFDEYEVMISDHNHKHELTDSDNRKGKGFDFNKLLGIA